MGWVLFSDEATAGKAERLPTGAIRVRGRISRTGIQQYAPWPGSKVQDRAVRIYRPAEQVFSDSSLATVPSATVTLGHPPEREVTPDTWKRYSVGHVEGNVSRVTADGSEFVEASIVISDADAIKKVLGKEAVEISQGYKVELDWSPGVTDSGEPYDAIQTQIVHNHTALLAPGEARAGKGARVLLDSNEEMHMTKEQFAAAVKKACDSIKDAKLKAKAAEVATDSLSAVFADMDEKKMGSLIESIVQAVVSKIGGSEGSAPASPEPAVKTPDADPVAPAAETEEEKKKREEEEAAKKTADGKDLAKKILDSQESTIGLIDARDDVREMVADGFDLKSVKSVKELHLAALKNKAPKVYEAVKDADDRTVAGAFAAVKESRTAWIKTDTKIELSDHRQAFEKKLNDAFDKSWSK